MTEPSEYDPGQAPQSREPRPSVLTRVLLGCLLGALALLCGSILRPFLAPLAWAVVLAYVTWPGYLLVARVCRERCTLAAAVMMMLVTLVLIGPVSWLLVLLQDQLGLAYQAVLSIKAAGNFEVPDIARNIPWIGEVLQRTLERYAADPLLLRQLLIEWAQNSRAELLGVLGDTGRNLAKLLLTLVTLFVLYRHGNNLVRQASSIVTGFFHDRLTRYFRAAGAMTRAVVYGLLATALVQGALAGVGYWVAGVRAPLVLALLTVLLALVPFGAALIWAPVGLGLLLYDQVAAGIGLLLWGALVVSWVDNLIRPLVISGTSQVHFLLVMLGVLGGLSTFGLIGMFVGPVALAVATSVWREWLEQHRGSPPTPTATL